MSTDLTDQMKSEQLNLGSGVASLFLYSLPYHYSDQNQYTFGKFAKAEELRIDTSSGD